MNLKYLLPRLLRHFLPDEAARFLLRHGLIIHPGPETSDPRAASERYCAVLEKSDIALAKKRVMLFGYGGNFAVGMELLRQGAAHVVLCDKYAPPNDRLNRTLLPAYSKFLYEGRGHILPNPEWITLFQEDIRAVEAEAGISPVDIVMSSSVFEHLPNEDMQSIVQSLARLTKPEGIHIHFIDLRDHFFRYPFEMLTFSEQAWRRWLNPTSNLNRCRLSDYARLFNEAFRRVHVIILEQDLAAFEKARPHIQPAFLTGKAESDAVTQILVLAVNPLT
jgi:SAM-dependent methyltransferase